ncbi:DUF3387 domain-containing protein [Pectobacterium parmentieri]|nr:DUF3387 domain-containing protein [Pectobacterium parmentieri]QPK22136.1 DUF3387 domain-containing protein [Pectobacterium parmentieri]QRN32324.1 DUF3387 domain-containing protein [Pectobacterium parmentieri]
MLRESVRARLRILVRQALHKYKCPLDKTPYAVELILKQLKPASIMKGRDELPFSS